MTDLVGLFILYNLTKDINVMDIGLYRDDGLMIIKESNGPKCERTKKIILNEFRRIKLKVDIISDVKTVNFLDVNFDLRKGIYQPYRKENSNPIYVHPLSNHPKSIIRHIPKSISKRISDNSSNLETFNKHKYFYNRALKDSGYKNTQIEFIEPTHPNTNTNRNRKRKILWYNPPFNLKLKTNLGMKFLNLIKKHFPINNILHKIFNKNTIKLSYSCNENLEKIIKKHNNKILNKNSTPIATESCNCRIKSKCPLKGNCQITSVVYQATISTKENPNEKKYYIGMTNNNFKERFTGHKCSFENNEYKNRTSLSKYYNELVEQGYSPIVNWKILKKAKTCSSLNSPCYLCLYEKLFILTFRERDKLLNKKHENSINCKHYKNHLLSNLV